MKPVKITITSQGKQGKEALPQTKQVYHGVMTEKSGKYYVLYNEDAQSGLEGTKTTLKWDQERVIIIRSGSVEHRQEFCQGLKDQSLYQTPYLKLPLLTDTSYVYTGFKKGCWTLEMVYTLYHGQEPYGDMRIFIEIEED